MYPPFGVYRGLRVSEGKSLQPEHTEACYKEIKKCVHEQDENYYPKGNMVTASEADQLTKCANICSEESGCITYELDCKHEHDESCGYVEGHDCIYDCDLCKSEENGTEKGIKEEGKEIPSVSDGNVAGEAPKKQPYEEAEKQEENEITAADCICETACGEDVNEECPYCSMEGADLTKCKAAEKNKASFSDATKRTEKDQGVQEGITAKSKLPQTVFTSTTASAKPTAKQPTSEDVTLTNRKW